MSDHPNVAHVRDAIAAFNEGDFERYQEFFDPDVTWHVGGRHPLAGSYRGRDQLFDYFRRVREITSGSLSVEPVEVMANDRHAGVIARVRAEREGRSLDATLAQAFRLGGDGQFVEYWAMAEDQETLDRFWS